MRAIASAQDRAVSVGGGIGDPRGGQAGGPSAFYVRDWVVTDHPASVEADSGRCRRFSEDPRVGFADPDRSGDHRSGKVPVETRESELRLLLACVPIGDDHGGPPGGGRGSECVENVRLDADVGQVLHHQSLDDRVCRSRERVALTDRLGELAPWLVTVPIGPD
jgi:hypothetical protein